MNRVARTGLALALALAVGGAGCGGRANTAAGPARPRAAQPLSGPAYAAYLRGRLALLEGRYDQAVSDYREALGHAPDEARLGAALLEALRKAGRGDEARRSADELTARWPAEAAIWFSAGQTHRWLGDRERARAAFARAFGLAPADEAIALAHVENLATDARRSARAEEIYRAHLAKRGRSNAVRLALGELLADGGRLAEAERELRTVVEQDPDELVARLRLATVLRLRGARAEATELLRRTFERAGGDLGVAEFLFLQLVEDDALDDARRVLELVEKNGDAVESATLLAEWELVLGQPQAALARFEALAGVAHPDASLGRLRALIALGRSAEAEALALALTTERTPRDQAVGLLIIAAQLASRRGADAVAIERAERAHAALPTRADALATLIGVLEIAGQLARARAVLESAAHGETIDPARVRVYAAFAARDRRAPRALALLEKLVRFDPGDLESKHALGALLVEQNLRLEEAEALLLEVHRALPLAAAVLDSLGWLRRRQGRTAEALGLARRAARLAADDPEILVHFATLQAETGDREGAVGSLARAAAASWSRQLRARANRQIRAIQKKE